jgi:hypothetical protein
MELIPFAFIHKSPQLGLNQGNIQKSIVGHALPYISRRESETPKDLNPQIFGLCHGNRPQSSRFALREPVL